MNAAYDLWIFYSEHLRLINLVWIQLQLFFLSDLLEPTLNRNKECFLYGVKDKFS